MSLVKCCFDSQQLDVPECLDSIIQKCTNPGCCFTCSCMRPRYKKLVDNIFPQIPQDGLVKNNMDKLIFFSLSSPEKLDRIGEYLYKKASRDISRKRNGFVIIAMEAMDQLLLACHSQTLNLFVESFLRMVQKLLESTEPDLQVLATASFVRFANIEEDTPSYHRRYDFFVSKFSSMCHSNHPDMKTRTDIRKAGIKGLQGVIHKTVSDDLVENIWEPVHMDKILPSLLYNMHDSQIGPGNESPEVINDKEDPRSLADSCVRELVGRASFGHVRSVLKPILRHFDLHGLWVPNHFAVRTFRTIMLSIQSQYSYAVVESLMSHLDENKESSAKIRTSIAYVLSKIISISAEESVGPSVLEIINSVLGHVRMSVQREESEEEALYREALIHCLGEFSAHLPDYQKLEIMVFIISKVPLNNSNHLLQQMLLKSLLTVGKKYTNVVMSTSLPISLLEPLLKLSVTGGTDNTIIVQHILHTLLDRHSNVEKLQKPTLEIEMLELVSEGCSRSDTMFMRKYCEDVYTCLVESLSLPANNVQAVEAIFTTLALIAVELISSQNVASYIALIYNLQEVALSDKELSQARRFNLHAIAVTLLVLVSTLIPIPPLKDYAYKVILARRGSGANHLLPGLKENYQESGMVSGDLLLEVESMADCMRQVGIEPGALTRPQAPPATHPWLQDTPVSAMPVNTLDQGSSDVDSTTSTPAVNRKWPEDELSFSAMKRVIAESLEVMKEGERKKQEEIFKTFRNTSFQDIVNNNTVREEETLQTKLSELLNRTPQHINSPHSQTAYHQPIYEVLFPELFAY